MLAYIHLYILDDKKPNTLSSYFINLMHRSTSHYTFNIIVSFRFVSFHICHMFIIWRYCTKLMPTHRHESLNSRHCDNLKKSSPSPSSSFILRDLKESNSDLRKEFHYSTHSSFLFGLTVLSFSVSYSRWQHFKWHFYT